MGFEDNEMEAEWARWEAETKEKKKIAPIDAQSLVASLIANRQRMIDEETALPIIHTDSSEKLQAAMQLAETLKEQYGTPVFDAEEMIQQGLSDQPMLEDNFDFVPLIEGKTGGVAIKLAQDARTYAGLQLTLQESWITQGYERDPGEVAQNHSATNFKKTTMDTVNRIRASLEHNNQGELIGRIDRALFVKRELDRAQKPQK